MTEESGQMLLLGGAVAFFVLVIGMFLFWLGASSTMSTKAQTAADAAALAGEQKLITEYNTPRKVNGIWETGQYSKADVCAAVYHYASLNHAGATCDIVSGSGDSPKDVKVKVTGNQALPSGAPDAGAHALAQARASSDSGAQMSPTIQQTAECTAGAMDGAPYSAHGGKDGFSIGSGANFGDDCESRIAGALDRLGLALHLHLTGTTGKIDKAKDAGDQTQMLEACSAAAEVDGIDQVSDSKLAQFNLSRPVPGKKNVIGITGLSCQSSNGSDRPAADGSNANVHLVDLNGGPAAAAGGLLGLAAGNPTTDQLKNACTIQKVWKAAHMDQTELKVALDVAETESGMGQFLVQIGGPAHGLFQQEASMGWYDHSSPIPPIQQEMDPVEATEMFLEGKPSPNRGLAQVYPREKNAPIWQIAQDVQGSGAGASSHGASNYGVKLPLAMKMYQEITQPGKCH